MRTCEQLAIVRMEFTIGGKWLINGIEKVVEPSIEWRQDGWTSFTDWVDNKAHYSSQSP